MRAILGLPLGAILAPNFAKPVKKAFISLFPDRKSLLLNYDRVVLELMIELIDFDTKLNENCF